jgi:tRNA U34 5-methylaminomethyl-2-thiouridine-forming methyltransferase MnmC
MYDLHKRSQKQTITTHDGSATLYSAEFEEHYHSTHEGALHESLSKHVIPALTLHSEKTEVTILDICFGLGYNTLATLHYIRHEKLSTKVHILSPEFDEALVRSLATFDYPSEFDDLRPVIEAISREGHYEDEQFRIDVYLGDARKFVSEAPQRFDIIYQDAFSPEKNPLLWTREWFADVRAVCAEDAVLTTYSTAAAIRMGLHENRFELHDYKPEGARGSLIASPSRIDHGGLPLVWIDMALKMERNPDGRSLRDGEFMG